MQNGEPGPGTKSRLSGRSILVFVLVTAFLVIPLFQNHADDFSLGWTKDGILLGAGLVSAALSEYLIQTRAESGLGSIDPATIDPLDKLAVFQYSKALDVSSTVLQYSTVALPLLLGLWGSPAQDAKVALLYLEALSYAYAAKNLLKYFFPRYRPYLYADVAPAAGPSTKERIDSFPSGHATMAFTAASFGVTVFRTYFPHSPYFLPFALSSFGLATLTASFRVLAGMHFITDVVTGALLGMSIGYLVPLIHKEAGERGREKRITLEASPTSILLRFSY
jgi:membrane-associated phospholipid phosphatase